MSYTKDDIAALRKKAEDYELAGLDLLNNFPYEELTDIVNGIGADWMPDWSRALTNSLHPSLEAVAMIHDIEVP